MKSEIERVILECVMGDISKQVGIDAVVNAANAYLERGGGVAGAIHRAAGPELQEICRHLAPIKPGHAVITPAFNLPNRYVIHCLGPVYGVDKPSDDILSRCYRNVLQLSEEYKISSVAFPAISTGVFGFPVRESAEVAFTTILNMIPEFSYITNIRFVLYDEESLRIHEQVLSDLINI